MIPANPLDGVFGHAIDTAEVAAICHADSQCLDGVDSARSGDRPSPGWTGVVRRVYGQSDSHRTAIVPGIGGRGKGRTPLDHARRPD
jgi:hypothetical protein